MDVRLFIFCLSLRLCVSAVEEILRLREGRVHAEEAEGSVGLTPRGGWMDVRLFIFCLSLRLCVSAVEKTLRLREGRVRRSGAVANQDVRSP